MPTPLRPLPNDPAAEPCVPHELDLAGLTAGNYFTSEGHIFMVGSMNLTTRARASKFPGEPPVRDIDEIDMRLVHAWWKCPND